MSSSDTEIAPETAPLVSVVVPIYKVAPYVRKCLRSIADQTYANFELILVNDATPDNSMDVARRATSDISNCRYIDLETNGGLGNARNRGIEEAKGKYIFFVDSDDWIAPDLLEKAAAKAEAGGAQITIVDFVRVNFKRMSRSGNRYPFTFAALPSFDPMQDTDVFHIFNLAQLKLYDRNFLNENDFRFETGVIYEDMDWHFKVLSTAKRVALVDEPLYFYRVGRPGSILSGRGKQHFDLLTQLARAFEFVRANGKEPALIPLYKQTLNAIYQNLCKSRRIPKKHRKEYFLIASDLIRRERQDIDAEIPQQYLREFEDLLLRGNFAACMLWRLQNKILGEAPRKPNKLVRKSKQAIADLKRKREMRKELESAREGRFDILFESYWGEQFADSPKYLYEYIKENHPELRCGFSLNTDVVADIPDEDRVPRMSEVFWTALRATPVLVNNNNFPELEHTEAVIKQINVQTFHGIPIKKIGVDVIGTIDGRHKGGFAALVRRSLRWDYLVTAGTYHSEILRQAFEVNPKMVEIGSPRTDPLHDSSYRKLWRDKIRSKFNLPAEVNIVLYAPTWRESGHNPFLTNEDFATLKGQLGDNVVIMVRAHHYANFTNMTEPSVIDVSDYPDSQELLAAADLVVTDYSSIAFDFATTGNIPLFYIPDYHEFVARRGVYFDLEEELGPLVCDTPESLGDKARAFLDDPASVEQANRSFMQRFMDAERPDSCAVLTDQVLLPFLNK